MSSQKHDSQNTKQSGPDSVTETLTESLPSLNHVSSFAKQPRPNFDQLNTVRIDNDGDLIWEPGMSDEESKIRSFVNSWRHGGRELAQSVRESRVAAGTITKEEADRQMDALNQEAERAHSLMERWDAERRLNPQDRANDDQAEKDQETIELHQS